MRENRLYGSEGGVAEGPFRPLSDKRHIVYQASVKIKRCSTNFSINDDGSMGGYCNLTYHLYVEIKFQNNNLFPEAELYLDSSLPGFSEMKIFIKEKINEENLKIKKVMDNDFSILKNDL